MPDRVFDERLDAHGRDGNAFRGRIDVEFHFQAVAKTGLLDTEVGGNELDFFTERRPLMLGFAERIAEDLRQPVDGFVGQFGLALCQAGDYAEGVE